jgi:hypothetical protein
MPKPEPFYLFFIVFFLIFYWKNNFMLGKYFILLGLIFSLKISTLPFVLFTFFYSFLTQFSIFQKTFTQLIKSLAYFLVGFLLGTPYLVMLLFGEMGYLHKYLGWTFYSTGHGSDNVLISYKDWILAMDREWSYLLPYSVFILPFLGICFWLYNLEFQNLLKKRKELFKIYLLFSSLSFLLPIILFVKRVWLIYLYAGFFLLFLFSIIVIYDYLNYSHSKKYIKLGIYVILVISALLLVPTNFQHYKFLATRTQSEGHKIQLEYYISILNFIEKLPKKSLTFYYDPRLYSIKNKYSYIQVIEFWGPFLQWNDRADFIILTNYPMYLESYQHDPARVDYNSVKKAGELFRVHVIEATNKPTYSIVYQSKDKNLVILQLQND